jgi:hypothetical protein
MPTSRYQNKKTVPMRLVKSASEASWGNRLSINMGILVIKASGHLPAKIVNGRANPGSNSFVAGSFSGFTDF